MYRNLLVALDLESTSDVPLKTGFRLTQEYGASVRIVSVVRSALLSPKGFFSAELIDRDELLADAKQALQSRVLQLTRDAVDTDVLVGTPSETISNAADYRGCDLIVIGARPRSRSEFILGTTATNILRQAKTVDLYACHRVDPEEPVERILVAIDGSELTPQVLDETKRLLETKITGKQPEVRFICVVNNINRETNRTIARCEEYVAASAVADRPMQVAQGNVAACLDEAIGEFDADLVIIGSGKNYGVSWLVGSTTNNVLHESACDVLIIRSDRMVTVSASTT